MIPADPVMSRSHGKRMPLFSQAKSEGSYMSAVQPQKLGLTGGKADGVRDPSSNTPTLLQRLKNTFTFTGNNTFMSPYLLSIAVGGIIGAIVGGAVLATIGMSVPFIVPVLSAAALGGLVYATYVLWNT